MRISSAFSGIECPSCAFDSALGVYDGNVYEALWERTKREPMNQREVTEAYEVRLISFMFDLGLFIIWVGDARRASGLYYCAGAGRSPRVDSEG